MTRRKSSPSDKLVHKIGLRVSAPFYTKMQSWLTQSNCRTIAELARAILYREKIIWYHKNTELESTALELAGIRKELNAIGNNVNQITRHFNSTSDQHERALQANRAFQEYLQLKKCVDNLTSLLETTYQKWSHG